MRVGLENPPLQLLVAAGGAALERLKGDGRVLRLVQHLKARAFGRPLKGSPPELLCSLPAAPLLDAGKRRTNSYFSYCDAFCARCFPVVLDLDHFSLERRTVANHA